MNKNFIVVLSIFVNLLSIQFGFADDFSRQWQGKWLSEDDDTAGSIEISECTNNKCKVTAGTGAKSAAWTCDYSGTLTLKSGTDAATGEPESQCGIGLTRKESAGSVTLDMNSTDACSTNCGQGGSLDISGAVRQGASASTAKPSFNCAKAAAPIEKLICSNSEIAQADSDLSHAYSNLKKQTSREKIAALSSDQKAWAKKRDSCMKEAKPADCILAAYKTRIAELSKAIPATK